MHICHLTQYIIEKEYYGNNVGCISILGIEPSSPKNDKQFVAKRISGVSP